MALFGPEQLASNRLQAHKSSFQAWKCVSFGCSLLAIVLLLSKWHEVTTDLQMLLGIDKLLESQAAAAGGGANGGSNSDPHEATGGRGQSSSWPPVPLEQLLPAANESNFGMESMASNESMLMSHLHMSLSRELSGNQLLRQEVDAFIGEFRSAKSTLSLSSLLVSVYIVSWILMTLAINDTRISNDISLRNILLLSVFGAIDVAASAGFVMVRLIMYSVKNNSFASELLGSAGLKDTLVRLSADQLTAFTALRLIAMRSCSAYVDVFVSVIVGLLTILRVHAILRALAYYRRLRRLTDLEHSQQQQHHRLPQLMTGAESQAIDSRRSKQIWSTTVSPFYTTTANLISPGSASAGGARLMSPTPPPAHHHQQRQLHHQAANELTPEYQQRSFCHLTPVMDPNGAGPQQQQAVYAAVNRHQHQQSTLPLSRPRQGAGITAGSASLTRAGQQHLYSSQQQQHQLQLLQPAAANSTSKLNNSLPAPSSPGVQSGRLLVMLKASKSGHSQQQQQRTNTNPRGNTLITDRHASSLLPRMSAASRRRLNLANKRGGGHPVTAARHSSSSLQHCRPPLRRLQLLLKGHPGKAQAAALPPRAGASSGRPLDREAECESEPHRPEESTSEEVGQRRAAPTNDDDGGGERPVEFGAEHATKLKLARELSQQNLLAAADPSASQSSSSPPIAKRLICDSSANTYTLLSADQLDKLVNRQRAQLAQTTTKSGGALVAENPTYGRAKLAAATATAKADFAPTKRRLPLEQHSVDAGQQSSDISSGTDDSSDESGASSLAGADDDLSDCSSALAILHQQAPAPAIRTSGRRGRARLKLGVRQTEELVASPTGRQRHHSSKPTAVFSALPSNKAERGGESLLLARYYYA